MTDVKLMNFVTHRLSYNSYLIITTKSKQTNTDRCVQKLFYRQLVLLLFSNACQPGDRRLRKAT